MKPSAGRDHQHAPRTAAREAGEPQKISVSDSLAVSSCPMIVSVRSERALLAPVNARSLSINSAGRGSGFVHFLIGVASISQARGASQAPA